jgi:acylphosphatase
MGKMKVRAHVYISGRVQGVFFRAETRNKALKNNVTGWIRNTFDNRVEAVFEGERNDVEKLLIFCRRGPPMANITKINVNWENYLGIFNGFQIRKTSIV